MLLKLEWIHNFKSKLGSINIIKQGTIFQNRYIKYANE